MEFIDQAHALWYEAPDQHLRLPDILVKRRNLDAKPCPAENHIFANLNAKFLTKLGRQNHSSRSGHVTADNLNEPKFLTIC